MSSSDAYNPVSDIVSGITENKCHGKVFHRASYWEKEYALEREAFANFGSAFIRKDREEVDYLIQMFPNAVEHFKNYFKR